MDRNSAQIHQMQLWLSSSWETVWDFASYLTWVLAHVIYIYIYVILPWVGGEPWDPPLYSCKTEKGYFGLCKMRCPA